MDRTSPVPKRKRYGLRAGLITALAYVLILLLPVFMWLSVGLLGLAALSATSAGYAIASSLDSIFLIYIFLIVAVTIAMIALNIHYTMSGKLTGGSRIAILILTAVYVFGIALAAFLLLVSTGI